MPAPAAGHPLAEQFRQQAMHSLPGSPLYERLLSAMAEDLDRGGPTAAVVAGHERDRPGTVLPLRLLGAVHRLVLVGALPSLAPYYPSVGGTESPEQAWTAMAGCLASYPDRIRVLLERPVQTNETGRAALLYGALLVLAARTGMPVRLLELGSSAGLNLLVDRYRYDVAVPPSVGVARTVSLGDLASPLRFDRPWLGLPPADLGTPLVIGERRGCDPAPLNPADPQGRLTLTSFVWPDDLVRLGRLRAALAVAATGPAPVDASGAAGWLAARLDRPRRGEVTMVWHSVVWQYVDSAERRAVVDLLGRAAGRATAAAPLAYVSFEPRLAPPRSSGVFELRMSLWPSGRTEEVLATAAGHGIPVRWSV